MVSHKDQECLAPSWSVVVRDCSGRPTPARSFEDASHLKGSRNPGIRAAWSPSAVHSRHWLSVPARVFVVLSDRMLAAPRRPRSKKSNPDHESRSGSCDRRERLLETAPGCGRMCGDVTVQNAATANFHNHEDIQQ